jgi:hypothetical protein
VEDGVIKYQLEFNQSKPIDWQVCAEIEEVRVRLYELGLIGVYENGIGYGNISQLIDGTNKFVITGTQTGDKTNLEAKDYSLIESIDIDTFKTTATGATKPSSESITHATIYQLSNEIKSVIHIHSESLWHYMIENNYLATSDVEYGSIDMVKDVINIYKNQDALDQPIFVMKGHFEGIVIFGKSILEAEKILYSLIKEYLKKS